MMEFSKIWLWLIILCSVISGCDDRENGKATITIKSTSQLNAEVEIYRIINLDQVTLIESTTDSVGKSSFDVPLQKPVFAIIRIGKKYGEVYLSSGYDLTIGEVGQNYKIPLKFSGKGAEINNYLSWVNSNVESIKWVNGRGLGDLDYNEFLHRFDSLKTTIAGFHKSYLDSVYLSTEAISMLEYKNRIKILEVEQEFKFFMLNSSMNKKWEAQNNGREYIEATVFKEVENLASEIPFDPTLLTDGYYDYEALLNFYWYNKVSLPVSEEILATKASVYLKPLMTDALIKKGDYPEAIREFLIAFNLRHWLAADGITPETDSIFTSFQRTYEKSDYLPALNKNYNEWLALGPGQPAPEFEGYTREGKRVSINDLKGKVVYIDVWATWCVPCIAAIPDSKKLQQEFSNEEKIQFLNVSVDSRRSDWEKFLQKDKAWKGLHMMIEPDSIQSLYTSYKLSGVPAYILIDPSGKIVTIKAPPPSDEKIRAQLAQLLAKEF